MGTPWIHRSYTNATRIKLGKITYPKIAYILYVSLYFYAILFCLSYRNAALGFPKVTIGTVCTKIGR